MTPIPVLGEIVGWEIPPRAGASSPCSFGSSQLPKLARSMGQASKEFRHGLEHGDDDDADPPTPPARDLLTDGRSGADQS